MSITHPKHIIFTTFKTPIETWGQRAIIIIVALVFVFMPQHKPVDWDLNTTGYWSAFPNSYEDPTKVYPPWGLILMLPYYWMQPAGVRVFSVLVIGLLTIQRRWSLSRFFAIVLSPFFLITLAKSNMDVFVFVFPILLWELSEDTRWQSLGWGIAMALSLLKPQGMVFIWIYWFWSYRHRWREMLLPFGLVVFITVPISLINSPPLFFQWIHNLLNPNQQNQYWWTVNNLSLTSGLGLLYGVLIMMVVALILAISIRFDWIKWGKDQIYASLLFLSFFLMPYASQQSASSAFAFIPSWLSLAIQWIGITLGLKYLNYNDHVYLFALFFSVIALVFFKEQEK
jgi:hypothetical protein